MAGYSVLIPAATTSGTATFKVSPSQAAQLSGSGFSGDTITVQTSTDGGTTWVDCYDADGTQVVLSAARNPILVDGPGFFQVTKASGAIVVALTETVIG